jgi:hypothetical protein
MIDINKFLAGYIGAALWSTTDCRDEEGNETYTLDDEFDSVSDACKASMLSDCEDFINANRETLEAFKDATGREDEYLGHDFWLTREGHGTGFWDRLPNGHEQSELGDILTDAAKVYSSFPLFGDFEMGCVRSHHYG